MCIIYSFFLHDYHPPVNIPIKYALFWGFQYPVGVGCIADVTYMLPASSRTKCLGRACDVIYRQAGVVLLDSEEGAARTWFKQQDWYLNGQKTAPLRPQSGVSFRCRTNCMEWGSKTSSD